MVMHSAVLAIGGGSGSGKTTLAKAIASRLISYRVQVIREDDYYYDMTSVEGFDPNSFNFDNIATHDHELLATHLASLRRGVPIEKPIYSFIARRRSNETEVISPPDLIIVEGIHILYANVLKPHIDLSVYLDVPDDIRFIRRLLRDMTERGREPAAVVAQYLRTVRPMYYLYTYPTRLAADLVLTDEAAQLTDLDRLTAPVLDALAAILPLASPEPPGGAR